MSCGNCGRQNPPGALYCLDCGQKLRDPVLVVPAPAQGPGPFPMASGAPAPVPPSPSVTACPRCAVENPAGIRFCRMCGLGLAADPSRPIPAPMAGARPCTRCGTLVDPGASFCGVCGLPSADATAALPLIPQTAPQAVSVREPVPVPAPPVVAPPVAAPIPAPPVAAPPVAAPPVAAPPVAALTDPDAHGAFAMRTDNFGAVPQQAVPQLVTILKDGSEGPTYRLSNAVTDLGRYEGTITLPDDPYLSPRHARVLRRNDRHYLRDLGSVNGIYYRIREPVELHHNDVVLVGQQVLRVEILADGEISLGPVTHYGVMVFGTPEQPRLARLVQLTSEGVPRDVFHLYRDETVIGRESGDLVFTDDVFLSRRHAAFRLDRQQRRVVVRDLGSSNGTLVLFRGEREVVDGDLFRMGHHLFRFDAGGRPAAGQAQGGGNGPSGPSGAAPR